MWSRQLSLMAWHPFDINQQNDHTVTMQISQTPCLEREIEPWQRGQPHPKLLTPKPACLQPRWFTPKGYNTGDLALLGLALAAMKKIRVECCTAATSCVLRSPLWGTSIFACFSGHLYCTKAQLLTGNKGHA